MKFIHAADLHLESPFLGLKNDETPKELWDEIYNSTFISFQTIVNDAINEQVDFILLAGDLFDRDNQTPKTYDFFQKEMEKLNENNIDVYMIFGNHDYFDLNKDVIGFPKNVHVFSNDVETKTLTVNGKKIAITGFSYASKWITDKKIDEYPVKGNVDMHIGMLHGGLEQTGDHYAPFSVNDLTSKNYDYWALGHIHKRQELNQNPPILYSGNIQGRHKNELGDKGYLLVTDNLNKLDVEFRPTSVIDWSDLKLNITFSDVESTLNQVLDELKQQNFTKMQLINLELSLNEALSDSKQQDFVYRLNNALRNEYRQLNAWIYEVKFRLNSGVKLSSIDQEIWDEAEDNVFLEDKINDIAKTLRKYDFIADHIDESSDDLKSLAKMKLISGREDINED